MYLDLPTFKTVIQATPLISIDLIVRNSQRQVLLGKRKNRPAQGYWFVPGGRIVKDETFELAFNRLTNHELGQKLSISYAEFLGPYEHHYLDNFANREFSTHYVVLGYQVLLDIELSALPIEQHGQYQWWDIDALLSSELVHQNTKNYFL